MKAKLSKPIVYIRQDGTKVFDYNTEAEPKTNVTIINTPVSDPSFHVEGAKLFSTDKKTKKKSKL